MGALLRLSQYWWFQYFPDRILYVAYAAVQTIRQELTESVREYHNRLTKAAGKLPGMLDQRDLTTIFQRVLRDDLSSWAQTLDMQTSDPSAFHNLVSKVAYFEDHRQSVSGKAFGKPKSPTPG